MKGTVVVVLVIGFGAGYAIGVLTQRTPSNRAELFDLRSKCSELAKGVAQNSGPFNSATNLASHYDPLRNRCYAEMDINGLKDDLYDAQTGQILAEIWKGEGRPGNDYLRGEATPRRESVREFIDKTMGDDRR
jgi:hypothetical protein